MRTNEDCCDLFFVWPFFSVSVMPHTEYGIKVLISFSHLFFAKKIHVLDSFALLFEMF